MYKCLECGHIFDEPKSWNESRGEFWGSSCSETLCGCPHCEGGYEEAYLCEICEEYFLKSELHGNVCDDCIKEYGTFENCYKIGAENTEKIKLNGLLLSFFSESEIEDILKKILLERNMVDCSDYIENDKSWFGEELVKEVIR